MIQPSRTASRCSERLNAPRVGCATYSRGLSRAFLARSRASDVAPAQHQFSLGDQVYYWRGRGRAKRDWSARWHGPAIVIGYEGNNLWLTHRNCTVKCSTRHVRLAEPEERLPWDQVFRQAFAEQPAGDRPDAPFGATDPLPPRFPGAGNARAREDEFLDLTPDSRPGTGPGSKRRRLEPTAEAAPAQPSAAAPSHGPVPPPSSAGPAAEETTRRPGESAEPGETADPTENDGENSDAMNDDGYDDYMRRLFAAENQPRQHHDDVNIFGDQDHDPTASSSTYDSTRNHVYYLTYFQQGYLYTRSNHSTHFFRPAS